MIDMPINTSKQVFKTVIFDRGEVNEFQDKRILNSEVGMRKSEGQGKGQMISNSEVKKNVHDRSNDNGRQNKSGNPNSS